MCFVLSDPASFSALDWLRRGVDHQQRDELEQAAACYEQVLRFDAHNADAWHLLGVLACQRGLPSEGVRRIRRAVELKPEVTGYRVNFARALTESGQAEQAVAMTATILVAHPNNLDALRYRAVALRALGKIDEAITTFRKLLRQAPKDVAAYNDLGGLLRRRGDFAGAIANFRHALRLQPDYHDARLNLATALLTVGEFDEGFKNYESRDHAELTEPVVIGRYPFPRWQGESLAGTTLLVHPEQGLGDEIMFASVVPELIEQAQHVVIGCHPKLQALFKHSFPTASVRAVDRTAANYEQNSSVWLAGCPPIDWQVPLGSLSWLRRRQLSEFPQHQGYLRPDPVRVAAWRRRLRELGTGPVCGVSWRGGTAKTGQSERSLTLAQLTPLLKQKITWVNLQYTPCSDELHAFAADSGIRVHHFQDAIDSYEETAALVAALDGVVSVCTAVIHLGGALGVPVWVMAPRVPEWRYGVAVDTMPWYPSVRVRRQTQQGEWAELIAALASELNGHFSLHQPSESP